MKQVIDISKSRLDTPDYRVELINSETSIFALEAVLKQLSKNVKGQLDLALVGLSIDYSNKNELFAQELKQLEELEKDEPVISDALDKFSSSLAEIEKSRKMMLRQMQDVFLDPIDNCIKKDVAYVKESRKIFERMSDNLDSSLERYLAKKAKDLTIPESADELAQQRREFHERSIRYANDLNDFQYKKRSDVLENVLALMYTNYAFFHQGYELLKDLEPTMRELTNQLKIVRQAGEEIHKKALKDQIEMMKNSYHSYSPIPSDPTPGPLGPNVFTKSGYLVKRGSGKITQVWSRRWFTIRGEYLVYITRGKKDETPTLAANLRLSTVKPYASDVPDRRFCFEVVSPVKSYVLQAENEREMAEWIEVIQNAIGRALNSEMPSEFGMKGLMASKEKLNDSTFDNYLMNESPRQVDRRVQETPDFHLRYAEKIKAIPGNQNCADCKADNPEWASINLGILLCIECSGIHRSLGVQVSKVRSLTLDKLERELYEVMLRIGNTKANEIFEGGYLDYLEVRRPDSKSDRSEKEKWISAKYVKKLFVLDIDHDEFDKEFYDRSFWHACQEDDLVEALKYLALGANIDWKNDMVGNKTALMFSVDSENDILFQFLVNFNADLNLADSEGKTCLHYAVEALNERIVRTLLKRNVDYERQDKDGKTPVMVAVEKADPEIVTALRMHQFELEQQRSRRSDALNRNLPSPPVAVSESEDELSSPHGRRSSPSKIKNFFTSGGSSTSPTKTASETPKLSSAESIQNSNNPNNKSTISATISSASSYANNAMASASKYFKSNFAKMHAEHSPVSSVDGANSPPDDLNNYRPLPAVKDGE